MVAVAAVLTPAASVTVTRALPGAMPAGAWKLICVGLIDSTKAATPLMETETPSSAVGKALPLKSCWVQFRLVAERLVP